MSTHQSKRPHHPTEHALAAQALPTHSKNPRPRPLKTKPSTPKRKQTRKRKATSSSGDGSESSESEDDEEHHQPQLKCSHRRHSPEVENTQVDDDDEEVVIPDDVEEVQVSSKCSSVDAGSGRSDEDDEEKGDSEIEFIDVPILEKMKTKKQIAEDLLTIFSDHCSSEGVERLLV
ncbi:hypothetical protein BU15DRAFT_68286 [Melanogaster broomeanus]|nr:hypothetical protein BU15DRAFT_68286 [Melanogaster broomeanus]